MEPLLKAIAILEPIDKKYPDQPGVTHYLIHSYDFPAIAKRGVPAATKYAKIAVAAPTPAHAVAHLLDGRHVGRIRDVELALGRGGERLLRQAKLDGTLGGVPHAIRLHGLRLPADSAKT